MEKETGTLLYEQNAHDKLEPASVTKVMTLLLVVEAIDDGRLSLDDLVTVSARAASMGGSQVYLKENEQNDGAGPAQGGDRGLGKRCGGCPGRASLRQRGGSRRQ